MLGVRTIVSWIARSDRIWLFFYPIFLLFMVWDCLQAHFPKPQQKIADSQTRHLEDVRFQISIWLDWTHFSVWSSGIVCLEHVIDWYIRIMFLMSRKPQNQRQSDPTLEAVSFQISIGSGSDWTWHIFPTNPITLYTMSTCVIDWSVS